MGKVTGICAVQGFLIRAVDETAWPHDNRCLAQMERFFCFDHLLVGTPASAAEQVTGWPIISSRVRRPRAYRRPLFADPSYCYGLARHGVPGVQADFVVFSRFTNDIGIA